MLRRFAVIVFVSFALAGWATAAGLHAGATVKIMTQNMDDGTDQTYIIAAIQGKIPGLSVGSAVDLTFQELQASNFEGRAKLLAKQIAEENRTSWRSRRPFSGGSGLLPTRTTSSTTSSSCCCRHSGHSGSPTTWSP